MLKSPVVFVLSLTIPVVEEDERDASWCQSLHALQFLLAGQFVAFVAGGDYYTQGLIGKHSFRINPKLNPNEKWHYQIF